MPDISLESATGTLLKNTNTGLSRAAHQAGKTSGTDIDPRPSVADARDEVNKAELPERRPPLRCCQRCMELEE